MEFYSVFVVFLAAIYDEANCSSDDESNFRQRFLDAHNKLRSELALGKWKNGGRTLGPAANMVKLKWDKDLESSARELANKCAFEHSNGPYGENIFYMTSPSKIETFSNENVEKPVNAWSSEDWNQKGNALHLTQIMWAETSRIGCYSTVCDNGSGSASAAVCQYSPRGNMGGVPEYINGETCSKCPSGSECEKSTGLCVFPGEEIPSATSLKFIFQSVFSLFLALRIIQ